MTKYALDHAGALADIAEAGASVTFTVTTPGTYHPATDTQGAPTESTVTGSAIEIDGDRELYVALSLIASETVTLFFTPTTYGTLPDLGASVTWGGDTYTVRNRKSLAPDGTVIAANVVVSK